MPCPGRAGGYDRGMMHVRFGRPNWDTVFPEMRLACAGHNIGACEMSARAALTPCQAASKPPVCVVMLPAWCAPGSSWA